MNPGELLRARLAQSASGARLEVIPRTAFSDALLRPLYELSNALMAESFAHFVVHAHTNEELHVFRSGASRELLGFQFWRTLDGHAPHRRIVLGGKLRIRPEARRQGLHLASGLFRGWGPEPPFF